MLDVHKERQMIGVLALDTLAQWDIPAMPQDIHDHQCSEEKDEERES